MCLSVRFATQTLTHANRKPLFLTCGHTCCRACLKSASNPNKCPKCFKKFQVSIDKLPINYDFIPAENDGSVDEQCENHGCCLDHFCVDCKENVCRKCVKEQHRQHRAEFMDDILSKDTEVKYFTNQLEDMLKNKLDRTTKSASLPQKLSNLIKENRTYLMDVQTLFITLLTERTKITADLQAWNDSRPKSKAEMRKLFKNLCRHWKEKLEIEPDKRQMLNLIEKLNVFIGNIELIKELVYESIALECSPTPIELLPNFTLWRVNNHVAARNALASIRAGRRPKSVTLVSHAEDRLWNVPELLAKIGSACTGIMQVDLLDCYWEVSTRPNDSLREFIEENGHKVTSFFGSVDDACAIARAVTKWPWLNLLLFNINRFMRPKRLTLGLRLAKMSDVDRCSALPIEPISISCIRGLPAAAGDRMRKLGWQLQACHFPDLQDADVDWMQSLLASLPSVKHAELPRCCLTEAGFRDLLESSSRKNFEIHCNTSVFSEKEVRRLNILALEKKIKLSFCT